MTLRLLTRDPRTVDDDDPLMKFMQSNARSIFETPEWFRLLSATAMRSGDVPVICGVEEDGRVLAVVPLFLTTETRGGRPLRRYGSLTNYFSLGYRPLGDTDGLATEARRLLGSELRSRGVGLVRFDALRLEDVGAIESLLAAGGLRPHREEDFVNWIEPVEGRSFEAYFTGRPSVLRSTYRRRLKKLEKAFNPRMAIYDGSEPDFDLAKTAYEAVYSSSWKQKEEFTAFTEGFMDLLAARKALRLGILYAGQQPLAAQLWFLDEGRAVIYKLAYDEAFADYSPGLILSVEMFRRAIDVDRVGVIDYGSGDDSYKADWMSVRDVRWGVEAYDPRRVPGAILAVRKAVRGWFAPGT